MVDKRWYILLLMVVLMLTGCQTDEPSQKVGLPISICLPANEVKAAAQMPRRAMGDPGTTERYLFPHYLYIIVMKQNVDESWMVWNRISRTLTDEDWVAERYKGVLPTVNDSIYRYLEEINLPLSRAVPGERQQFKGRVYAIASAVDLSFSPSLGSISDLDELLDLQFDASSETIQKNLQHIYATPYNLKDGEEYFGAFNSIAQHVPHVDLLLYHVAAKVDITWYVDPAKRINKTDPAEAVRLTYMEARYLFNGQAYCFKPMKNEVATLPTSGYDIENIVTPSDEGLWWEGRKYFYTIPYVVTGAAVEGKVYFPLQMLMETNESGDKYQQTVNMKIDTTAVFVPWMRANFNLTKPLTGVKEYTVDN